MQPKHFRLIFQVSAIVGIAGSGLKEIRNFTCEEYEESNDIVTFTDSDGLRQCFNKKEVISIIPVQVKTEYFRRSEPKISYKKFDYFSCKDTNTYSTNIAAEPEEEYGYDYTDY